jgi:tetratricopeptide (TPR) repeat protein
MRTWVFGALLCLLVVASSRVAIAEKTMPSVSMEKPLTGGISQEALGLSDDIQFAEALVKQKPNDPEAHFLLAVAYSRTPYLERALEELDQSRKLARKSPEGFSVFDRKIADYEKMLLKTPDDPLILYRLGFGYYIRGYAVDNGYMKDSTPRSNTFYNQAEQTFRHLVAIDATDFSARNYLGYLLAEQDPEKNYEAAVALWEASLVIHPENPGAYMLLGQAALQKGNLRQAVHYSAKALQSRNSWLKARGIDPDQVKVRL